MDIRAQETSSRASSAAGTPHPAGLAQRVEGSIPRRMSPPRPTAWCGGVSLPAPAGDGPAALSADGLAQIRRAGGPGLTRGLVVTPWKRPPLAPAKRGPPHPGVPPPICRLREPFGGPVPPLAKRGVAPDGAPTSATACPAKILAISRLQSFTLKWLSFNGLRARVFRWRTSGIAQPAGVVP